MKEKRQLTLIEEQVLNCIPKKKPVSSDEIVTRKDISKIVGIDKRAVSAVIEKLREEYPICSNRGKGGFWLGNKEEALHFANECKAHANGLLNTAANIEAMFIDDEDLLV